jgi:hypothetical protein
LARYVPTRVNEHTKWRFTRERRDELIQRIGGGPPNARQGLAIDMLVRSEWGEHVASFDAATAPDAQTRVRALQVAENARKQVLLWNRELTAATPPLSASSSAPRPMTMSEFMGRR